MHYRNCDKNMIVKIEVEVESESAMKFIIERIASTLYAGDARMLTVTVEQKDR